MATAASRPDPVPALRLVLMGVAGCGKSSIGIALAPLLGARYLDGDDLHPPENIAKMRRSEPLNDEDRWPWLERVGAALHGRTRTVIGCSALKRFYRDQITKAAAGAVTFVHLAGSRQVIEARMRARTGHFMPASLLDSQFADLETPSPGENAFSVAIDQPFDEVIAAILARLDSPPA